MRELKFRYYWKPTTKIIHSNIVGDREIQTNGWVKTIQELDEVDEYTHGYDYVAQYTGLKDKNGKEIYEGDVIYFRANYTTLACGWMNGKIGWDVEEARYWIYANGGQYDINKEHEGFDQTEVIGNIFENPELLSPND